MWSQMHQLSALLCVSGTSSSAFDSGLVGVPTDGGRWDRPAVDSPPSPPADSSNQTRRPIGPRHGALSDTHGRRRKRFDYEDTYEWEDDDDLTYDSYYEEEEERGLVAKVAVHWRTAGPRLVMLGAFLLLLTLLCCGCLRLACRFWCKSMAENCACCCCPALKNLCQSCYTDPMYERVRDLGEAMGIEISFNTYEMIKDRYGVDDDNGMPTLM